MLGRRVSAFPVVNKGWANTPTNFKNTLNHFSSKCTRNKNLFYKKRSDLKKNSIGKNIFKISNNLHFTR